jgi:tripartite ATP-independent transporter DctP family solute receptor
MKFKLIASLALFASLAVTSAQAQQSVTIRAEHDEPSGSITDRLLNQMAEDVSKATGGKVKLEVHSGSSLSGGKIPTMIQNVQAGNVDLSFVSSGVYAAIDQRIGVLSLPFMCGSIDDLEKLSRKSGIMDKIYADQDAKNFHIVDTWTRALRQIANNKREIKTPADIKGLRFRVPEFKLWIDTFKTLGATPVPLPFSEIPTALQLGTIDGAERPSEFLKTESWWDLAKYVSMVNYSGDVLLVAFNKAFWDKLDQPTKKLLTDKLKEYGDKKFNEEKTVEQGVIELLRQHNVKVTLLTPDEVKQFRTAMDPVWADNQSRIGKDLIAAAEKAVAHK